MESHELNPNSTAEQTSAKNDASWCLQRWPENAHFVWLLLQIEEIKSSLGKPLTRRLAVDTSFPLWMALSESKIVPPIFLGKVVLT